ncbi:MAG: YcaO-like family protein [Desulfobacteraceae bacterium]|jgi:ribosomal protein S12 methylthiotransferase accessory factor
MEPTIVLKDAFKGTTRDQDKVIPPEETVRRFRERLEHVDLDILQDTVRIDNGRLDIPVYFSLCGRDAEAVVGEKKQMGKGGTPAQAEASAVMELVERFSLFSFEADPEPFLVDTYRNLEEQTLAFEAIAKSVHDESEDLDRAREAFSSLPMRWCRGTNLTRGKDVLIPFDWFFTINEFNGSSAGNDTEEALLQGICEVVERHTSSIISRESLRTAAIRLDSATDEVALDMIGKYRRVGVQLYPTDFSLDTGIPGIGVLAYDPSTFPNQSEIVWTAGTTPSPQKALNRALTEVAQLAGDFSTSSNYVASGLPKLTRLEDTEAIRNPGREIGLDELPDLSHPNLRVEVENCLKALAAIGMEVLALETTHPLLEIPAFYTLVPGAHFRERAAGSSVGLFTAKLIAEKRHPAQALQELERMDRLLPGKYYIRFFQGLSLFSLGEPDAALQRFEEALDLGPRKEEAASIYSYMGQCLKDLEQYEDAIRALNKGAAVDADRTDILNLLGFCHFKLGEHEQAIRCFERILKLDPSSAIDYANIASNYREMGDRKKAIHYYQLALELDPTITFARESLARLEGK